ncbi:MAG TPA: hypothetical protein VJ975_00945 [Candidatus Limnocylindria bacterium]|nr:hypothetical protein [Candidatus Limnocylindria bacterium]
MRSSSAADRFVGWLLPLFAVVAEGALLAVVYVAVETTIDHRAPLLGVFELAAAAGVTAYLVHRRWIDPDDDPLRFLGWLALLGLAGWLWDADVRRLLLAGDPVSAFPLHPGGWLMVVAGMRGVARGVEIDDRALTRLVLVGVPALAVPWIIGQVAAGDLRDVFIQEAFVASISFVTAGFIAAGLARLQEIGRETGIDWRHDRSWLGTVFGVLVVVLAIGIPASILLGLPSDAVARGILAPIISLLGYVVIAVAAGTALVAALLATMLKSIGISLPPPVTPNQAGPPAFETLTLEQIRGPMTALIAAWIVIAIVLVVLARVWLRRRPGRTGRGGSEERSFRLPEHLFARRRKPAQAQPPRRRGAPTDAVGAYLAALDDLEALAPSSARGEGETPRAHAGRVRLGMELDALQADYGLARYGGRSLSPAEHRRAIGRWQRLRQRIRSG